MWTVYIDLTNNRLSTGLILPDNHTTITDEILTKIYLNKIKQTWFLDKGFLIRLTNTTNKKLNTYLHFHNTINILDYDTSIDLINNYQIDNF